MWQAPSQRMRALAVQKKRDRDRMRRPLHIKRVNAEIKLLSLQAEPQVTIARVILNDLTPKGMGLFCASPLLVGQEVAITLEEPKRIYLRGRIVWCQEYDADSHVLSQQSYSYRMGIQFIFESPEEQVAIRRFCEQLENEFLRGRAS